MGLQKFVGRASAQFHNLLFLAAALLIHFYLTFLHPDLTWRSLNLAGALLFFFVQCSGVMFLRVEPLLRPCTRWTGIVFAIYSALFSIRIAELIGRPFQSSDYFQSGGAEAIFHLSVQTLFVLLTYSLGLMVNRRLLMVIGTQEEKYSKAFHSAPYAILITRLADGKIIEVNDGFELITGYAAAEVLGKTTFELAFWAHGEDRAAVVKQLSAEGRIQGRDLIFRNKSGEPLIGHFSAATITIRNEKCVLSSISDITARKQAEAERERLLAEREKALSEIKVLSGLLPICMSCKQIRDDQGYWNKIELYIRSHSQAEFSHGLCPACAHKLYPEYIEPPP